MMIFVWSPHSVWTNTQIMRRPPRRRRGSSAFFLCALCALLMVSLSPAAAVLAAVKQRAQRTRSPWPIILIGLRVLYKERPTHNLKRQYLIVPDSSLLVRRPLWAANTTERQQSSGVKNLLFKKNCIAALFLRMRRRPTSRSLRPKAQRTWLMIFLCNQYLRIERSTRSNFFHHLAK